jgi:hypothetical protein
MERIWNAIRRKICPKQISRYGSVAIEQGYFDERTLLEKVCDKIDKYYFQHHQRIRANKSRATRTFRPIFDWSLGRWLNNVGDIKELERKGNAYISVREWEELRKKKDAEREKKHLEKIESQIKYVIREVKQGRKFTEETRKHREEVYKKYGTGT